MPPVAQDIFNPKYYILPFKFPCGICKHKVRRTEPFTKAYEQTIDGTKTIFVCLECFKNECCWYCNYWTGDSYCNGCRVT